MTAVRRSLRNPSFLQKIFTSEDAAKTIRLSCETGQLLNAFISKINNE